MPESDPTMLIVGLAIVVGLLVAGAWLVSRRRRRGRPGPSLEREESISYYRDLSGRSGPGVREEDSVGRWGERD